MDAYEAVIEALSEYRYRIHHGDEAAYDHLKDDGLTIEVINENKGDEMLIEFNGGEVSLFFGDNHDHFDPHYDDEIYWLIDLLEDLLENRKCVCSLYGYEGEGREKILATGFIRKRELQEKSLDEIFEYVYRIADYKKMIDEKGGKVTVKFWDAGLNYEKDIGKKQFS